MSAGTRFFLKAWIFSFFFSLRVNKQGPYFTAIEDDGSDKRLVELELACKADGVALLDPI